MFRNYLKIAWRNLVRNRTFTVINITGLAIGMATCLLISLFVLDELSYDRFNEKADRIVRVSFQGVVQGEKMSEPYVMPPVAQALRADYPAVQDATRLRQQGTPDITVGETTFRNQSLAHVDANFFDVFTLPLLEGKEHCPPATTPRPQPFTPRPPASHCTSADACSDACDTRSASSASPRARSCRPTRSPHRRSSSRREASGPNCPHASPAPRPPQE